MKCPKCNNSKTQVLETRRVDGGVAMKRTRSCTCGATFATFEVNGAIWNTVAKWAMRSNAASLEKKRVLRKRNAEIIARVRNGEQKKDIAKSLGLSKSTISTITTKAKLPR